MWFLYPRLVFVASRSTYQSIILVYPPSHLPSVLRPGPARRVDPGPGRPGSVAGPGPSKKQAGNWPGQTRSTQRVDPGTGRPGQTRLRPGYIFFYILMPETTSFWPLQLKSQNDNSRGTKALQFTEHRTAEVRRRPN